MIIIFIITFIQYERYITYYSVRRFRSYPRAAVHKVAKNAT